MTTPLVELRDLWFTYPKTAQPALAGLDLRIDAGEMLVVMGRSGAGKTTLARCLNRAIPAYQPGELRGEVWIDGVERSRADVAALAGVVGLVTQDFEAQLFSTNVALEVAFGMEQLAVPRPLMRERVDRALRQVGLEGFERRDPSTLSGGEKQRLSIAAVLAMQPKLIVFDEPTTDLDPQGKRDIFAVLRGLRSEGVGVVLIEHEPEACRGADRLLLMSEGRIVEDSPPEMLLRRVDRLAELGVPAGDLDRLAAALGHEGRFPDAAAAASALRRFGRQQVIPAKAGIQAGRRRHEAWTPAFAGETREDAGLTEGEAGLTGSDEHRSGVQNHSIASTGENWAREVLVEARDVEFAYADGPPVLRGVSAKLYAREIVALVGANGSGKTTFSKHLNGLLKAQCGSVVLRGRDVAALDLEEAAADVGYVFQNPDHQIFAESVRAEVRFAAENLALPERDIGERAAAAIAEVGLEGFENEDPFGLGKGQRQRLAVASLLVLRPRLLILDEPTTGLDAGEQREMMQLLGRLRDGGTSILIITHAPWIVAEWAQRCLVLDQGRLIFDGPVAEFLADPELVRRSDFEPPDAVRVGAELGIAARSVDDLLAAHSS